MLETAAGISDQYGNIGQPIGKLLVGQLLERPEEQAEVIFKGFSWDNDFNDAILDP